MPKEIMKAKSPKKPVKIHPREYLKSIRLKDLVKYCKGKNLPYYELNKKKIIENILAWQKGKEVPYKTLNKTWDERINGNHTILPVHKQFAFEIATNGRRTNYKQLADKYGVKKATIQSWRKWPEVQIMIDEFQSDLIKQRQQKVDEMQVPALEGLKQIIDSKKPSDVKRKACNDALGYGKLVNVNVGKVVVQQKQAQGVVNKFDNLTVEELLEKEAEYDELLEETG